MLKIFKLERRQRIVGRVFRMVVAASSWPDAREIAASTPTKGELKSFRLNWFDDSRTSCEFIGTAAGTQPGVIAIEVAS